MNTLLRSLGLATLLVALGALGATAAEDSGWNVAWKSVTFKVAPTDEQDVTVSVVRAGNALYSVEISEFRTEMSVPAEALVGIDNPRLNTADLYWLADTMYVELEYGPLLEPEKKQYARARFEFRSGKFQRRVLIRFEAEDGWAPGPASPSADSDAEEAN